MNSEYIITRDEIVLVNKKYGGSLRNDAEIETSLYLGKGKNIFRKIAYIWRAILVGHPFTNGNKRTALMTALVMLERSNIKLDKTKKEHMIYTVTKIAKENITNISRIERLVRYVVTRN